MPLLVVGGIQNVDARTGASGSATPTAVTGSVKQGRVSMIVHFPQSLSSHALFTVAPSLWYECFPFAVLESLACGVPALVAGHGGLAAMLAGREVAMTFRPGDAADLRARAAELAVDPARRRQLGERGRALVESEFSDHAHYRRLTGIYRELVP